MPTISITSRNTDFTIVASGHVDNAHDNFTSGYKIHGQKVPTKVDPGERDKIIQ